MSILIHGLTYDGQEIAFDTGRGVTLATHDEIRRKLMALERRQATKSKNVAILNGSLVDWSDLRALSAAFDERDEP